MGGYTLHFSPKIGIFGLIFIDPQLLRAVSSTLGFFSSPLSPPSSADFSSGSMPSRATLDFRGQSVILGGEISPRKTPQKQSKNAVFVGFLGGFLDGPALFAPPTRPNLSIDHPL